MRIVMAVLGCLLLPQARLELVNLDRIPPYIRPYDFLRASMDKGPVRPKLLSAATWFPDAV